MNYRSIAEQLFLTGVDSVLPDKMIRKQISVNDSVLTIGRLSFPLDRLKNFYVIGAGKASGLMAHELEAILGDQITEGHIVVKYGHSCRLEKIKVTEAGHPVPDTNGFEATKEILKIANKAQSGDLVICLLSGGGSALLADYPEGCSPEDLISVNNLLLRCGADIQRVNTIRKHMSNVKGGQLAKAVFPATLVSLILSDVIGDPLDVIASGPTAPDKSTFKDALEIIDGYKLTTSVPNSIMNYLSEGKKGNKPETPKVDNDVFKSTYNLIIGSNRLALDAVLIKAKEFGLSPDLVSSELHGNSIKAAEFIVNVALRYKNNSKTRRPGCLLFGGETTIDVKGNGIGGRNQHLALFAAILLKNQPGITILSAGTDGNDGPTDSAGAVVDSNTYHQAISKNIDPLKYLTEFDSFNFFKIAGGHIITGPTMTNVMDLVIVIVE